MIKILSTVVYILMIYIINDAENLNVQVFSCCIATLCPCGSKKIQVRYVC